MSFGLRGLAAFPAGAPLLTPTSPLLATTRRRCYMLPTVYRTANTNGGSFPGKLPSRPHRSSRDVPESCHGDGTGAAQTDITFRRKAI